MAKVRLWRDVLVIKVVFFTYKMLILILQIKIKIYILFISSTVGNIKVERR
jgi:hypothetical protein